MKMSLFIKYTIIDYNEPNIDKHCLLSYIWCIHVTEQDPRIYTGVIQMQRFQSFAHFPNSEKFEFKGISYFRTIMLDFKVL